MLSMFSRRRSDFNKDCSEVYWPLIDKYIFNWKEPEEQKPSHLVLNFIFI